MESGKARSPRDQGTVSIPVAGGKLGVPVEVAPKDCRGIIFEDPCRSKSSRVNQDGFR